MSFTHALASASYLQRYTVLVQMSFINAQAFDNMITTFIAPWYSIMVMHNSDTSHESKLIHHENVSRPRLNRVNQICLHYLLL